MKSVNAFIMDRRGTVATEYAATAALVSIAGLLAYLGLGEEVRRMFTASLDAWLAVS